MEQYTAHCRFSNTGEVNVADMVEVPDAARYEEDVVYTRHWYGSAAAKLALSLSILTLGATAERAAAAESAQTSSTPEVVRPKLTGNQISKHLQPLNAETMTQHVGVGAQDEGVVNSGDPARVDSAMDFARNEQGATWWRAMFGHADLTTEEGLARFDTVIAHAEKHGLKLNITLKCNLVQWNTKSIRQMVRTIATRHPGKIDSISICNEPNYENKRDKGWLRRLRGMTLPETYGFLYEEAYDEIQKVNKELGLGIKVWFGELSSKPGITPKEGWVTMTQFLIKTVEYLQKRQGKNAKPVNMDAATAHPYQLTSNPLYPSPNKNEMGMGSLANFNATLVALHAKGAIQTEDGGLPSLNVTEIAWLANTRNERKKLLQIQKRTGKISGIIDRFIPERLRSVYYRNSIRKMCTIRNANLFFTYGINSPDPEWEGWFNVALRDKHGKMLPTARDMKTEVTRNSACIKSPLSGNTPLPTANSAYQQFKKHAE
jgi:hypothetical protein